MFVLWVLLFAEVAAQSPNRPCWSTRHRSANNPNDGVRSGNFGRPNHPGVPFNIYWEKWLPIMSNGQPHPNLDIIVAEGITPNSSWVYPDNHPDLDALCTCSRDNDIPEEECIVGMPAVHNLFSGHPNIDVALSKGEPLPHFHPELQGLLWRALTLDHPNLDEIMAGDYIMPENHPSIEPWADRLSQWYPPALILSLHLLALLSIATTFRFMTCKLCNPFKASEKGWTDSVNVGLLNAEISEHAVDVVDSHSSFPVKTDTSSVYRLSSRATACFKKSEDDETNDHGAAVVRRPTLALNREEAIAKIQMADDDTDRGSMLNLVDHGSKQLHNKHVAAEPLYDYGDYAGMPAPKRTSTRFWKSQQPGSDKVLAHDVNSYSGGCMTRLHGLLECRIPGSQWKVMEVLVVSFFVMLNFWSVYASDAVLGWPVSQRRWGAAFGSLSVANFMFAVVPATRNNVITWLLGISFDHVILYHRALARWAMLTLVLHFLFLLFPLGTTWRYMTGYISLSLGVIIMVTSINSIRRKHFNLFYYSHFLFIPFFVFTFLHHQRAQMFVMGAIVIYAVDRVLRRVWSGVPRRALLLTNMGDSLAQLRTPKNPVTNFLGLHKVGQYFFINFPSISLTEWHPFSVSSGPREMDVQFHIRDLGDHTKQVVALSKKAKAAPDDPLPYVRIDGPYGVHDFNFRRYPCLMLVGGGVGITPIIGILKDVYNVGNYSAEERHRVIPHSVRNIFALWVVRYPADFEWFKHDLEQCALQSLKAPFPNLHAWVYVSRGGPDMPKPMIPGRPEFEEVFQEMDTIVGQDTSLVFACGPDAMVNELWDRSIRRSISGSRTDFHHETFNF